MRALATDEQRLALEQWLTETRARTERMLAPLGDGDLERQYDPIMSPLIWDVGHVANFEELWLLRELDGRPACDERLDQVYNPFENPRWVRGDLGILNRREAFAYLMEVRRDALAVMRRTELDPTRPLLRDGYVWSMVAQHEAQHQETMLQAMDLRGDLPPYPPVLQRRARAGRPVDDADRVVIAGGAFELGTDDVAHAYDNERPRHLAELPTFALDRFPVTVRRYAEFVATGGYERPEWWSPAGWAWREDAGHDVPQGWFRRRDGDLFVRRFGHAIPLEANEVVQHVSYWEAEAFCRFAGGRLPTEAEWEKAARWDPVQRRARRYPWGDEPPDPRRANLDHAAFGPAPAGAYPLGASAYGVEQLVGDVYEWTSSDFQPYPGYETFPYAEYSEVFFGDGYKVLRGASWATSSTVSRATFRNWDYAKRRQIFSGIRVAYDV